MIRVLTFFLSILVLIVTVPSASAASTFIDADSYYKGDSMTITFETEQSGYWFFYSIYEPGGDQERTVVLGYVTEKETEYVITNLSLGDSGEYTIKFSIRDKVDVVHSDSKTFTYSDSAEPVYTLSIDSPSHLQSFYVGDTVTFSGSTSNLFTPTWSIDGTEIATDVLTTTHTFSSTGTYEVNFAAVKDDTDIYDDNITIYIIETPIVETPVVTTVTDAMSQAKSSSSSNESPPTLGYDSSGTQQVENGIVINGVPIDAGYFYTEMPLQHTSLDEINNLTLKIYENRGIYNIANIQFGIGVKEVGSPLSETEALIEIHPGHFADDIDNPVLKEIIITDKNDLVENVNATLTKVTCGVNSCLQVEILWSYSNIPTFTGLMVNMYDYQRDSSTTYFNKGIAVDNPALYWKVGHAIYWKHIEIPTPVKENKCTDKPLDEINGPPTRNNCHFRALTAIMDK